MKGFQLFEAARRSLTVAELLLARLADELDSLATSIDGKTDVQEKAAFPWISAVSFVDFAHRFGSVIDALPGVPKNAPETRRLRDALVNVETARHHLQHLRGDLSTNEAIDYPLFGTIAWTRDSSCYVMCLSSVAGQVSAVSIEYDTWNHQWTSRHRFTVKHVDIDLDSVLREMKAIYEWIVDHLRGADPKFLELKWGQTLPIKLTIAKAQDQPER